jgi:cyclopropane-fatty-acyl-phospholipid synthase
VRSAPDPKDLSRLARLALALLGRARQGRLRLYTPEGQRLDFGLDDPRVQRADLHLKTWRVFERALRRGDVGFGESWMDDEWDSPDPVAVLRFMLKNRDELDRGIYGTWLGQWIARLRHWLHRNTRKGSRRNIAAHYDLGNNFYRLWLDASMTYSSALRDAQVQTVCAGASSDANASGSDTALLRAQHRKYDRVLEVLALAEGAQILEIGCGWGGFAARARRHGLNVRGLTLSAEQLAYCEQLHEGLKEPGVARFALQDYRDERGTFDAVVSIEMFEAVGEAYWGDYFAQIADRLRPGGQAVIQTITIDERNFLRYRASTDFIQQYIFPGGMLPSAERLLAVARRFGLHLRDQLRFGPDYAWTLGRWRERFLARQREVLELGYDRRFQRMWDFYLAYCQAGFEEGATDVIQLRLQKTAPAA